MGLRSNHSSFEQVIKSMEQVMREYYGNPSSLHKQGVLAERLLQKIA